MGCGTELIGERQGEAIRIIAPREEQGENQNASAGEVPEDSCTDILAEASGNNRDWNADAVAYRKGSD